MALNDKCSGCVKLSKETISKSATQQTFTCSKFTIEAREQSVKYVQS